MKKVTLSKKDSKNLMKLVKDKFNIDLEINKKDKVEKIDDSFIVINNIQYFFYFENQLVPTLKLLLQNKNFLDNMKKVVIDMGAVRFLAKGADLMRPGIVSLDDFDKNEVVAIVDMEHKSPIALGLTLASSEDILKTDSGKVIRTIHYVGDDIWNR